MITRELITFYVCLSNGSLIKIFCIIEIGSIFFNDFCPILYIYIYIYIYLTEHNRHFLSTYFFVNPFELLYLSYDIRRELVDKPSIISYFPSTFCPTLGHHQGRMYYKSDVNFGCTLLLCKNERLYCCMCRISFIFY